MNVRVFGDRQTGKTEMLLAFAEKLCRDGQKVLYVADDGKLARNCLQRSEQSIYGMPGFHVYRSNGNERITHTSGGELRFTSARSASPRGWQANTMILDDVPPHYGFDYPAERVVRASP